MKRRTAPARGLAVFIAIAIIITGIHRWVYNPPASVPAGEKPTASFSTTRSKTIPPVVEVQLAGLPDILYLGESLNFQALVRNKNPAPAAMSLVYEAPDGAVHRQNLAVPPGGERMAFFPLSLEAVPVAGSAGHFSARVNGKEVFAAPLHFLDARGEWNGLRTDGDHFVSAVGNRVVLVNRYENEADYRRWAPVKWAARAIRSTGAPYRIWTDTAALASFRALLAGRDAGWREAVPIADPASWPERLESVDTLIPADGALRLALAVDPDTSLSLWVYARWLDALIDRIRARNAAVEVTLVVPPSDPAAKNTLPDGLAGEILRLAREHHLAVFDATTLAEDAGRFLYNGDPALRVRWPAPDSLRADAPAVSPAAEKVSNTLPRALESAGEAVAWMPWTSPSETNVPRPASGNETTSWPMEFPGVASLAAAWPTGRRVERLSMEILLPADAPEDLRLSAFAKDKDGLWFQATAPPLSSKRFPRGQWRAVVFDFSPGAPLASVGHAAAWNAYYASRMTQGGLQLFSTKPWTGAVHFRRPEWTAAPANDTLPPARFIRLEAPTGVAAYRVAEWSFDLDPVAAFPCDPDAIRVDLEVKAPDGKIFARPAFFDQPQRRRLGADEVEVVTLAGRASWKARFTPLTEGPHSWRLVAYAGGVTEPCLASNWHPLVAAPGKPQGFVRVSKSDPRYFEDAAGKWFYPIGENIHAPFDKRAAEMLRVPVLPNRGTFAYDYYFAKMAASGQNSVVLWMSNWWVGIEWSKAWKGHGGLADYHLANAWKLDQVFAAAERHGIHINLVLDNHGKLSGWVDPEWDSNPYNAANGGPCRTPEEFFTSLTALDIYKKRLRYIVGRWGAHPNLLGLEIISEINLVGTSHSFKGNPAQTAWLKRVADHLAEIDAYDRPITLQYSNDWQSVDERAASMPELDYLVGDAYKAGGSIVPMILETAKQNARFGKPTFSAEFGGNWNGTTPQRLHSDLHCGVWANAMTATAGAPHFWWYDYIDRYDLYPEFAALAKFLEGEDRRNFHGVTRTLDPQRDGQSSKKELGGVSYIDAEQGKGYAWLVDRLSSEIMPEHEYAKLHEGVEIILPAFAVGEYGIEYWNTFTGKVVHRETRHADDGGLVLFPPAFKIDMAIKINLASPSDTQQES